jgi:hypothetical protein
VPFAAMCQKPLRKTKGFPPTLPESCAEPGGEEFELLELHAEQSATTASEAHRSRFMGAWIAVGEARSRRQGLAIEP